MIGANSLLDEPVVAPQTASEPATPVEEVTLIEILTQLALRKRLILGITGAAVLTGLAIVVREEGVGWVIPPARPDAIASCLLEAQARPGLVIEMGRRARLAAQSKYTKQQAVQQYKTVIEGLNSK